MSLNTVITHDDSGGYKVKMNGKLDVESTPEFERQIMEVLADPKVRTIRLELAELTFISSIGLGVVAKIRNAMNSRGGMVIVGAQPPIAKVFELVKVLPKATLCANHKEADEYLAAVQKKQAESAPQ